MFDISSSGASNVAKTSAEMHAYFIPAVDMRVQLSGVVQISTKFTVDQV